MSVQKRYTAHEMREIAKSMTYGDDESSMEFVVAAVGDNLTLKESVDETNMVASILRQAADAEEENAQLKARLEAVVKMLEEKVRKTSCDDCGHSNGGPCADHSDCGMFEQNIEYDAILRAARGESENENK